MKLFQKVTDFKSDYTTFPKTFEKYRWYTPILVLIISYILFSVAERVLFDISYIIYPNLYNFDNVTDIVICIILIMAIPSIYLGTRIVRDRPFSSYLTSAGGGWNWELFAKSAAIFLAVNLIIELIMAMIFGFKLDLKSTTLLFLVLAILTPLQSFAEELTFRGWLMQTLGSWFNFPIIAIVIQAIVFALAHGYESGGFIAVLISGLIYGFLVWYSKGLEITTALHSIHNIIDFVYSGISVTAAMTATVSFLTVTESTITTLLSIAVLIIIDKKSDWINLKR